MSRVVSEALDAVLGDTYPVLDHGFVRVVDYMGTDASVVQAARVSYGKGTTSKRRDRDLIRYLLKNKHTTPFEMCEIKFHVKLPIFVARQWIRHRTASVNEYSARYSELDNECYVPELDRLQTQDTVNRQGSGDALPLEVADDIHYTLTRTSDESYQHYQDLLERGLSRELSRMVLPTNFYTQWYWKIDLWNLLHFLRLRCDLHAQYEIRLYANVIADIVAQWVPDTYEAFKDFLAGSVTLSADTVEAFRKFRDGELEPFTRESSGLSRSEWDDVLKLFPWADEY